MLSRSGFSRSVQLYKICIAYYWWKQSEYTHNTGGDGGLYNIWHEHVTKLLRRPRRNKDSSVIQKKI